MRQPRARRSRVQWRIGLPPGALDLTSRVALTTQVHLSLVPDLEVPQTRILPLRIHGDSQSQMMVTFSGVSAPLGRDGTFTLRGGGGNKSGAWREMVVGRVEGRRILISIYQCHLVLDRGNSQEPIVCKVLFRGTSWARF